MASTTRKSAAKAPTQTAATAPAVVPPVAAAPAAPPVRSAKTAGKKPGSAKPAKVAKDAAVAKAPKTAKAAPPVRQEKVKEDKVKKAKLVRDSFTIPKPEYMVLEQLKQRATQLGAPVKKSELLRAGIKALAAMDSVDYLTALAAVPAIKTGRPAKS